MNDETKREVCVAMLAGYDGDLEINVHTKEAMDWIYRDVDFGEFGEHDSSTTLEIPASVVADMQAVMDDGDEEDQYDIETEIYVTCGSPYNDKALQLTSTARGYKARYHSFEEAHRAIVAQGDLLSDGFSGAIY